MKHVLLATICAALLVPVAAVAAPSDSTKFTLFGTAARADNPQDASDDVISIDTTGGAFGGAVHALDQTVHSLDRRLSFDYYFVNRTCGGGSPRITLVIDTTGDGVGDFAADGHAGALPSFTGCPSNTWRHEDLTDGSPRWDIRSLPGNPTQVFVFAQTWMQVETFFAAQPGEQVLRGIFVDDSGGFFPAAAGLAYYDTIVMGDYVLEDNVDARLG